MSTRYVSLDRVRGLRALQRSSAAEEAGWQASLLENAAGPLSRSKTIPRDSENLCRVLGATSKTNQYGEYLSVRCWCAQPPRYSPDLRALKLLVPDAVENVDNLSLYLGIGTVFGDVTVRRE